MKHHHSLCFLVLLTNLFMLPLLGQEHRKPLLINPKQTEGKGYVFTPITKEKFEQIPALPYAKVLANFREIGANYSYQKLSPEPWATFAHKEQNIKLYAQGFKVLGKFDIRGQASFSKNQERELEHSLTAQAEWFYPFIIADEQSANFQSEDYHISTALGYQLSPKWRVGSLLGYRGILRYSRQDPRSLVNSSENTYHLSTAYQPKAEQSIALDFGYKHYNQSLSYSILRPNSSEQIYLMRPLGSYNYRYSGKETNGKSYEHRYRTAQAQVFWLRKDEQKVRLSFSKSQARLETSEAGVYLSELNGRRIEGEISSSLYHFKQGRLSAGVEASFKNKTGLERIYRRVPVSPNSSIMQSELLTEREVYEESTKQIKTSLSYQDRAKQFDLETKLYHLTKSYHAEDITEDYFSHYDKQHLGLDIKAFWSIKKASRLRFQTNLKTSWQIKASISQAINTEQASSFIEREHLLYLYGAKDTYQLSQSCYIALGKKQRQNPAFPKSYLKIKLDFGLKTWQGYSNPLPSTALSLAYIF